MLEWLQNLLNKSKAETEIAIQDIEAATAKYKIDLTTLESKVTEIYTAEFAKIKADFLAVVGKLCPHAAAPDVTPVAPIVEPVVNPIDPMPVDPTVPPAA